VIYLKSLGVGLLAAIAAIALQAALFSRVESVVGYFELAR
jgi:hypothetical protein